MTSAARLPTLDASTTVALLVAADPTSAPDAAWAVARRVAATRKAALIDLALGEGALDRGADDPGAEGIVDVFEFGASWNHVARPQRLPNLYYVPDGTSTADPHAIWGHARWEKLRRGFREQGALLLLYAPAKALADLAPRADAVVVLGEGPAADTARALAAGRDLPLHGPVGLGRARAGRPTPRPAAAARPPASRSGGWTRWAPWLIGIVVAAGVFTAVTFLLRRETATPAQPDPEPATVAPAREAPAAAAEPAPAPPPPTPEPAPAPVAPAATTGDSLFYGVQVAAFNRLDQATALADELEAAGQIVAVTPVLIGRVRWYRVVVGALETTRAAAATRADLWRAGLLERGQGTLLRVPQAVALGLAPGEDPLAVRAALRQQGVPAYIVSGPAGPVLYLGAFETPEQAGAADPLLTAAARPHTLVARRGRAQ